MKATGIVRAIDPLGRIVIPMEIRKNLGLIEGTPMEIFTEEKSIVLKQYKPGCDLCGEVNEVREIQGIKICPKCIETIKKL